MPSKIVSPDEWLRSRKELLEKEKEHTRRSDELTKARANLPMVQLQKSYKFTGPNGEVDLGTLFEGKKQLILVHVMLDPDSDEACKGCSFVLDNLPHYTQHLHKQDTMLVAVARAPYEKINKFCKERMGWNIPFYSSYGTDFNYDFNVTMDNSVKPVNFNYDDESVLKEKGQTYYMKGEQSGMSVFLKENGQIFHTYSLYGRGVDQFLVTFSLLDITPLGRQDKSHGPAFPYHDTYDTSAGGSTQHSKDCH